MDPRENETDDRLVVRYYAPLRGDSAVESSFEKKVERVGDRISELRTQNPQPRTAVDGAARPQLVGAFFRRVRSKERLTCGVRARQPSPAAIKRCKCGG